jgi:aminoglycoside phosphotransferase (APT) family kinase protein
MQVSCSFKERAAGTWSDDVNSQLVETVFQLNDLQRDRDDGKDTWTNYVRSTLLEGADGYCVHATLQNHDAVSRELLGWIRAVGTSLVALPATDVVHLDFHQRNVLRNGAAVSAVIDWEGARIGDRAFDLVTFCFGFTHANAQPGLEDLVWERAAAIAHPDALRAYVAHMGLRRLDWTIRHHPEEVEGLVQFIDGYVSRVA